MKESKILSIKLKIGGREITLTKEEAKNLHDSLAELFGRCSYTLPSISPWIGSAGSGDISYKLASKTTCEG